jgi:ketosteroid isomerase-like protein
MDAIAATPRDYGDSLREPDMKGVVRSAVTCTLAFATGCGISKTEPAADADDRLRLVIARYDSAWKAKDTVAVSNALAQDYVYFTSTGGRSARAQTLEFLADTSYSIQSQERTDVDVSIVGGVARAASRWRGLGRYRSDPVDDDQTCVQHWRDVGGRWEMFTEQCVNRPRTDSAGSPP